VTFGLPETFRVFQAAEWPLLLTPAEHPVDILVDSVLHVILPGEPIRGQSFPPFLFAEMRHSFVIFDTL
jgi:hypothetical protein